MKKLTSYEIGADYQALEKLVHETFVDQETGEARTPTEKELAYIQECFNEIKENAETKFNNLGKFIRNIEFEAGLIEAEKKLHNEEASRLLRRQTAYENKAKGIKGVAAYLMGKLDMKKIKTPLFSFGWQSTRKSAKENYDFNADLIPVEFLKRELSASAINEAVKEGRLYEKDDAMSRGKLFYIDRIEGIEKALQGVSYLGGETLVLR